MSDKLRRTDDRKKHQLELTQDIHLAIYGDGNGRPGLVTKVDRLETWMYRVVPKGLIVLTSVAGFAWWVAMTFVQK